MSHIPGPVGSFALPNEDAYWAACDEEDLPQTIIAKAMRYRDRLRRDGRLELFRRSERTYYGQDAEGGMANSAAVTFGGEQGELVMIRVNHYRSILQGMLATSASRRPSYDPRATNNDTESARQVTIARSLLEAYSRICDLEGIRLDVALCALLFGEGYYALRWNTSHGRIVGMTGYDDPSGGVNETGEPQQIELPVHEGDLEATAFTPMEVIHDLDRATKDLVWALLPYRENIWDLAARYPEHREELLKLRGSSQQRWPRSAWSDSPFERPNISMDADIVTVWWLYHMPTDALPRGRHSIVCGDVVLYDDAMPLEEVPVYCVMPEREVSVARGHSGAFDLLALQQVFDAVLDTMLTAHDALGMQTVVMPKGTDISPEMLANGLRLIEYTPNPDAPNAGKPEALQLMQIPRESGELLALAQRLMETLSGINSVIRGDPMPQLKSGAALALVQSLAVQFNTRLQSSIVRGDERVGTGVISLLKKFAVGDRIVELVGRSQRGATETWSKDDLSTVSRVTVEVGSPMQDTTAGRMEIATQLIDAGMVKEPQQFIEVLTTGRLEPVTHGAKAQLDLIADENELLANPDEWDRASKAAMDVAVKHAAPALDAAKQQAAMANPRDPMAAEQAMAGLQQAAMGMQAAQQTVAVSANLIDDHGLHVHEHRCVLSSRTVRSNPVLVERVMKHIMEHEQLLSQMDPFLAALTQQSVPPPPPPMAGPMPMGPPPGPGGPPKGPPGLNPPKANADRAKPAGGEPPMGGPMMPTIAGTSQRAPNPSAT